MIFPCVFVSHFLHPPFVGHLGGFHHVVIINNAVMNMSVQMSLVDPALNSLG